MDKIYFTEEDDALVDVDSPQKKQKKMKEAWVCINDPFLHQMKVWTAANPDDGSLPDKSSSLSIVKYHEIQVLQPNCNRSRETADDPEPIDEETERDIEVIVDPKAKRVRR